MRNLPSIRHRISVWAFLVLSLFGAALALAKLSGKGSSYQQPPGFQEVKESLGFKFADYQDWPDLASVRPVPGRVTYRYDINAKKTSRSAPQNEETTITINASVEVISSRTSKGMIQLTSWATGRIVLTSHSPNDTFTRTTTLALNYTGKPVPQFAPVADNWLYASKGKGVARFVIWPEFRPIGVMTYKVTEKGKDYARSFSGEERFPPQNLEELAQVTSQPGQGGGGESAPVEVESLPFWSGPIRVPNYSVGGTPFAQVARKAEESGKDQEGNELTDGAMVEGSWDGKRSSGSFQVKLADDKTLPVFLVNGSQEDLKEAWPGTLTVSWSLGEPEEVEAVIISPSDYATWLPEGGNDEKTPGNTLIVFARVHKKDQPQKIAWQKAKFKFELVDVSKEKGVCLNWPSESGSTDDFDLKIEKEKNLNLEVEENGLSATSYKFLDESQVTISCFDWGACGKLKVTAILDDGAKTKIEAYLDSDKSKHELKIPKDDDDNYIADGWEKKYDVYGGRAADDKESIPEGDGNAGDGLTLYEEYRGFMENGTHIFGDPKKKDLFICNKIGQRAELGISIFKNISGLAVHSKLKPGGSSGPGELDASRIINLKHTKMAHTVDQHGVFIDEGDEGLASMALPLSGFEPTPGPPKKFEKVKIGLGFLGEKFSAYERAQVVAHELLHCCSVWHHGDIDLGLRMFQTKTDAAGVQRIYMFSIDGAGNAIGPGAAVILINEKTGAIIPPGNRGILAGLTIWIGSKQGQHSGNTDCVMRYTCAHGYRDNSGKYEIFADKEIFGLDICTDGQGTGVNEPGRRPESRYGNATAGKGDCTKQICVNDKYH